MLKIAIYICFCVVQLNFNAKAEAKSIELEAQLDVIDDVTFYKLGTYRGFTNNGSEYQKTYFFPRYTQSFWAESKAICKVFDYELATLETLEEANALLTMSENHSHIKAQGPFWLWIDGITVLPKTTDSWYWSKTGKKISFPIPWVAGSPNNKIENENCLAIGKLSQYQKIAFFHGSCSSVVYSCSFVCQRIDFYIP